MRSLVLTAVVFAVAAANVRAETFQIDPAHSQIGFKIRHLMGRVPGKFNKFEGSFNYAEGKPASWSFAGTVDAASIDTGNEKRDAHLRTPEFFDVEKCPKIEFKSTKVLESKGNTAKVQGDLTMHCVTKPVVLDVEFSGVVTDPRGNRDAGASATGKIARKDFGITYNKTLDKGGLMLGEDVDLMIEVEGVAKSAEPKAKQ